MLADNKQKKKKDLRTRAEFLINPTEEAKTSIINKQTKKGEKEKKKSSMRDTCLSDGSKEHLNIICSRGTSFLRYPKVFQRSETKVDNPRRLVTPCLPTTPPYLET
ncbi:hypothetical protein TNCV_1507211 [Trichonephila clavipes]|nr:hypothetical protein TNCV_1507211 [Trichonephila clavipes]